MEPITVTVSIDTEEDNWGAYWTREAETKNIALLPLLQERLDAWGARPTYLVNRPPLLGAESVRVLGDLAQKEHVEIGTHVHPWNTPPYVGNGADREMLCTLSLDAVRGKINEVTHLIESELGVIPTTFRAGRWGFGSNVALSLTEAGYLVDASVTPFIDWSLKGGPDYTLAPSQPYRFEPDATLVPTEDGPLVELPTTVGFLRGPQEMSGRFHRSLSDSALSRMHVVGALDRLGLLARKWLSPESSTFPELKRLTTTLIGSGQRVLGFTFHSCTLLPGATPFVRDDVDQRLFLDTVEAFVRYCSKRGYEFRTLGEVGASVRLGTRTTAGRY